jgi:hypothetical protein
MTEHGQGYEDSGRPMTIVTEVWPVAADETGLYLLGQGPRPSLPVMDDAEPHDYAEMELMQAGMWASTKALHSTSWRIDYDKDLGQNYLIVTYLAIIGCADLVRAEWGDDIIAITTEAANAELGNVPTHGATEAPAVRHFDVLFHGLRHLLFLLAHDATVAATMDELWRRHLAEFEPAIARMYDRMHDVA